MTIRPLLALLLLVAACAAAPQQRQYLLEAPAPAATAAAPAGVNAVGVREIAFPLYARRQQIPSQDPDGAIVASDTFRWAEEPPRAATRLLARNLAVALNAPTYVEPWPQGTAPKAIIAIEVDRFIGALGGDVRLEGQIMISHPGAAGDRTTTRFAVTEPVGGDTHADLAGAYGRAIARLSTVVGDTL